VEQKGTLIGNDKRPFFNVSRGTITDYFLLKKVAAAKRLYNLTLIPSL
jgi:hypothetical protein